MHPLVVVYGKCLPQTQAVEHLVLSGAVCHLNMLWEGAALLEEACQRGWALRFKSLTVLIVLPLICSCSKRCDSLSFLVLLP